VGEHGRNGDGERGRRAGPYLAPKQKESAVKTELLPEPFSPPMKLICAQITELVVLLVTALRGAGQHAGPGERVVRVFAFRPSLHLHLILELAQTR